MSVSVADILIVITGEPIESVQAHRGGYGRLIREAVGDVELRVLELDARTSAPVLLGHRAVVVTGSAASVTDREPWVLALEAELRRAMAAEVPVFGICFGHQVLGQALGGHVAKNPRGREIGTVTVETLADDALLAAQAGSYSAHMTHVDSVLRLPQNAKLIGRTAGDGAAVVRYGAWAWGVQFHPEMDAAIMAEYVEARSSAILGEGLDLERIRREVRNAAVPPQLLRRFLELSLRR